MTKSAKISLVLRPNLTARIKSRKKCRAQITFRNKLECLFSKLILFFVVFKEEFSNQFYVNRYLTLKIKILNISINMKNTCAILEGNF